MRKIILLMTAISLNSCIKKISSELDQSRQEGKASTTYAGINNTEHKVTVEYGEQPKQIEWRSRISW